MGLSAVGLANGGGTEHFSIGYDDSLPADQGLDIALQVLAVCEDDYAMMVDWFGGQQLAFNYPIYVNIMGGNNGGSWQAPRPIDIPLGFNATATIQAGPGAGANVVRFLMVGEITEMLMMSQNGGWWEAQDEFTRGNEGSKGEALSRFLAYQFKLANGDANVRYPTYEVVYQWLNSAGSLQTPPVAGVPGRPNYVDSNADDFQPDVVTGCTTAFVHYLWGQLDFSPKRIIAAGSGTLGGVYTNLTGRTDGWASFIGLVDQYYPAATAYDVPGDELFPVAGLSSLEGGSVFAGSPTTALLSLNNHARADIVVALTSDNPALVAAPPSVTMTPGDWSVQIPLTVAAVTGPAQLTTIHAGYAGQTLSAAVEVLPRPSTLSGQITDTFGAGLPDSSVGVAPSDPNAGVGAQLQLSTDENGAYATPPLAPGIYIVSASQGAYVPQQIAVTVAEGVPVTIANFALELTLPFTVEGQVTSQAGAVVVGATLTLSNSESNEDWIQATTDGGGAYALTLLPHSYDRVFDLSVVAPGFVRIDTTVAPPNGATVQLPIELVAFGSLSGVVNDTGGAPVSGAAVAGGGVVATTDASGAYSLAGLTPGEVDLTIEAPGFDTLAASLVIASAVDTPQNFALTPATAVITGTVVDAIDLSPMSGVSVLLGVRRTKTDTAGAYQFTAVSSGQQTISTGGWGAHGQRRVVEVVDHQTLVVDFTFSPTRHKGDPVVQ